MKNTEEEEPDFQNDSVTNWVLNSSEKTVEENNAINEPRHGSEKDCWFPIHFTFDGMDHTADVLKTERTVIEYHVTGILPVIDHLPDPFIIAATPSKEAFDFPVNETYYPRELGLIMVEAIDNGCNRADVALS